MQILAGRPGRRVSECVHQRHSADAEGVDDDPTLAGRTENGSGFVVSNCLPGTGLGYQQRPTVL